MTDKTNMVNGWEIVKNGKGGFELRQPPEQPDTLPESTPKTPEQPKPPATQEPVSFNKRLDGVALMPKKRPQSTQVFPHLAKAALARVSRKSWPFMTIYMPPKYKEHVKLLQATFGTYELGLTPHELNVWVTRKMPKSWSKKKKAEKLGRYIMSGSSGSIPDVDNALGTIMDALFPQKKVEDWHTGKKTLVAGTGDDAIVKATFEMRWAETDTIRVQCKPLDDTPVFWDWVPKPKNTLF